MPCVQRKAMELGPMTHFGSVNHVARQVASNHRPHTRPVFLIGKTDLRQLRSVVVTWDATSCRHGTDIEMLYGPSVLTTARLRNLRFSFSAHT